MAFVLVRSGRFVLPLIPPSLLGLAPQHQVIDPVGHQQQHGKSCCWCFRINRDAKGLVSGSGFPRMGPAKLALSSRRERFPALRVERVSRGYSMELSGQSKLLSGFGKVPAHFGPARQLVHFFAAPIGDQLQAVVP